MKGSVALVDNVKANQSRQVFWDNDVYQLEVERIFSRCWLMLGHDSLLPKPGDFITTYMAEDRVILSRQSDGSLKAFINACTHRGNQVCHADSGSAKAFVCNYHGWVFGQDGALVDVPMEERCYHNDLDKSKLGLSQIRVETYKGFIFGCHDADAPPLQEYLGEYCWYLDTIWDGPEGGMELLGPPLKSYLSCNWKVPTENFIGDGYHVGWTHAAALQMIGGELAGLSGNRADMPFDDLGLQFTMRHGHGGRAFGKSSGLSVSVSTSVTGMRRSFPIVPFSTVPIPSKSGTRVGRMKSRSGPTLLSRATQISKQSVQSSAKRSGLSEQPALLRVTMARTCRQLPTTTTAILHEKAR